MDFMGFFENLHIDPIIALIVLCAGIAQSLYELPFLDNFICLAKLCKTEHGTAAWKTLIISFLFSGIYLAILQKQGRFNVNVWDKYFISFFAMTSLYDLFLKRWVDKIKDYFEAKKIKEEPAPTKPTDQ